VDRGQPAARARAAPGRSPAWLVEDALPLATLEARPSEIALVDARGATRLVVRLGEVSDWPDGERGVIASGGTTVASFWLPTGEGARVSKVAVSLP